MAQPAPFLRHLRCGERTVPRRLGTALQRLRRELDLAGEPNNASLLGFKTYNSGMTELAGLRATCGSWPRFFAAIGAIDDKAFAKEQQEEIGPVIASLASRCPRARAAKAVSSRDERLAKDRGNRDGKRRQWSGHHTVHRRL